MVLSFGPNGISGHYDHITVGVQAKKIAKKIGARFYAVTLPPKVAKNALAYFRTRRSAGHYASDISFQKLSIRVSIDPKVKKRAIRAHLSQMDSKNSFTGFPDFAVRELLKAEYFIG